MSAVITLKTPSSSISATKGNLSQYATGFSGSASSSGSQRWTYTQVMSLDDAISAAANMTLGAEASTVIGGALPSSGTLRVCGWSVKTKDGGVADFGITVGLDSDSVWSYQTDSDGNETGSALSYTVRLDATEREIPLAEYAPFWVEPDDSIMPLPMSTVANRQKVLAVAVAGAQIWANGDESIRLAAFQSMGSALLGSTPESVETFFTSCPDGLLCRVLAGILSERVPALILTIVIRGDSGSLGTSVYDIGEEVDPTDILSSLVVPTSTSAGDIEWTVSADSIVSNSDGGLSSRTISLLGTADYSSASAS